MESTYHLLGIERGIPEVFNSTYDVRTVIAAATSLRDGQPLHLPGPEFVNKFIFRALEDNVLGSIMAQEGLIPDVAKEEKKE